MMDLAVHSNGVDEQLSLELGRYSVSNELLCSVDLVLMFNRSIADAFQVIERQVGKDRFYAKITINVIITHDAARDYFLDIIMPPTALALNLNRG